jgi:exopolysaccharide biosynthesis protein
VHQKSTRNRIRTLTAIGGCLVAASTALVQQGASAAAPAPTASESVTSQQLAAGLNLTTIVRTAPEDAGYWTATVLVAKANGKPVPDPDAPLAVLGIQADAQSLAVRLQAAGFSPTVEEVDNPAFADLPAGTMGWRVRVGHFATVADVKAEIAVLGKAGFGAQYDFTLQDGPGPGDEHIKVLTVDPRTFHGQIGASHGGTATGRATTSQLAQQAGALAAVNAGFFVISPADGIPGAPGGIGVYDGNLESAATNGRVALVLGNDGRDVSIRNLSTQVSVTAKDGTTHDVDGVNRVPGLIRDCGGDAGDLPTTHPLQDVTCTDPNEIVLFTPQLGSPLPTGAGVQVVLDANDRVVSVVPQGTAVAAGDRALQGIGEGAAWLQAHAVVGRKLKVDEQVVDANGCKVRTNKNVDIVNAGPWLVRAGQPYIDVTAEGDSHPGEPAFLYGWGVRRQPRTFVGVDGRGRLLIVEVDGRQPGYSEGMTLPEEAAFMKSLGAVNAMNLDGGGSSAMVVNGQVVTSPSDATGQRPVGDALVIVPGR